MNIYILVFEDNQLEMIDANTLFLKESTAEKVKDNYQKLHNDNKTGRKVIVKRVQINQN